MTNVLFQDISAALESGELADSFIAPILWRQCQQTAELEPSKQYDWQQFKKAVIGIDELQQRVDVGDRHLLENDVAVLAAYTAIEVAGATEKSTAALDLVAGSCLAVFAFFHIDRQLSQIERYRLYHNAYDASRGASECQDDVLLVLRNAGGNPPGDSGGG